jgi:molybdenum cofactor biosynthesis enzyme MoaA
VDNHYCKGCNRIMLVCSGQLMCVVRTCPEYSKPVVVEEQK